MTNNKRIEQLAISVQCDRHWTEEDIQKFAEVLLREAAEVADCNFDGGRCPVGYSILKHFGVE